MKCQICLLFSNIFFFFSHFVSKFRSFLKGKDSCNLSFDLLALVVMISLLSIRFKRAFSSNFNVLDSRNYFLFRLTWDSDSAPMI